jgi:hypothetical protein
MPSLKAVAGHTAMREKQASAALVVLANPSAGRGAGAGGRRPGRSRPGRAGCRHRSSARSARLDLQATSWRNRVRHELAGLLLRRARGAASPHRRRAYAASSASHHSSAGSMAADGTSGGRTWNGHRDCQDEGGSPRRAARERKTEAHVVGELRRRLVLAGQGNRWVGGEGEEREGKGKKGGPSC